jgi:hypothetical protein
MVTQVTISPSFQKKMAKLNELAGDSIEEKLLSLGLYAVEISPVWSGAFVNSWSIVPIGSGAGRMRTSSFEREGSLSGLKHPKKSDAQTEKSKARDLIAGDVKAASKSILEKGGAVLTNRSPHAKEVDKKHLTITRVKDRFR